MAATLVWFSGLETGGPVGGLGSEFDAMSNGGGGVPSYQTVTKRSGSYGLLTPHDGFVRIRTNYGSNATTFLRLYFRVTANPTNTVPIFLGANTTASSARGFRMWLTSAGNIGWDFNALGGGSPAGTGATAVSLTDWNLLEVKFVRDAAVGGMEIFLNGVLQVSDFTHATTTGTSLTTMTLFFANDLDQPGTNRSGIDINWDDLAFATGQYIGAGQCVAVQGQAGAPTYDAWTKNGAGSSAACWSDTPWASGTNCSDATSGDRQTMQVNSVALKAAIAANAVINGAMIALVGHSTTATGNASRTRRIGGVDTDGAARNVPITTDTFMPSGINGDPTEIFVDTRDNLAAAEIGLVRGALNSGTGVVTAEDVWLMVDFTPGPPTPLLRDEAIPVEWRGGIARDEAIPVEWKGPILLLRDESIPIEWVAALIRLEGLPVEWLNPGEFVTRTESLPVEWSGEPQGTLLLIWNVLNKLNSSLALQWAVISGALNQGLQIQWNVKQALPGLTLRWRVLQPGLVPPQGGQSTVGIPPAASSQDIQQPTSIQQKTP